MMPRILHIRLLLFFFLTLAFSCKKSNNTSCLKLISPIGDNVDPLNTTFNWTKCNATDTITLYIISNPHSAIEKAVTLRTLANQHISPIPLLFGTKYNWIVSQNNQIGDTGTFTTSYSDTLALGTYQVDVIY